MHITFPPRDRNSIMPAKVPLSVCCSLAILIHCCSALVLRMSADTLYDVPVSNHGARVRIIIQSKNIGDAIKVVSPQVGQEFQNHLSDLGLNACALFWLE